MRPRCCCSTASRPRRRCSATSFRCCPIAITSSRPTIRATAIATRRIARSFAYTFDHYAGLVGKLTEQLGVDRYALYVTDYGAPVGFRIATAHPERVSALIVQNGNASHGGIAGFWDPIKAYWKTGAAAGTRRHSLAHHAQGDRLAVQQRREGPDPGRSRCRHRGPGAARPAGQCRKSSSTCSTIIAPTCRSIPGWQSYFRRAKPPTLVVWGKNDDIFVAPGAAPYKRDIPDAEIHMLDTGHFALETHGPGDCRPDPRLHGPQGRPLIASRGRPPCAPAPRGGYRLTHRFGALMFTPHVKAVQEEQGSRASYARFEAPGAPARDRLEEREEDFIAARDSFYMATVSETGWPYVQHRGGPPGFLKVLDDRTLGFADYRGNKQYVSVGNLATDDRVSLFLMDYPNQRRLKLLGHARTIDAASDPALLARLQDHYPARSNAASSSRSKGSTGTARNTSRPASPRPSWRKRSRRCARDRGAGGGECGAQGGTEITRPTAPSLDGIQAARLAVHIEEARSWNSRSLAAQAGSEWRKGWPLRRRAGMIGIGTGPGLFQNVSSLFTLPA